jgi:2-polyprenyl-3-methyl-5-hydroxy-6-metoxy-1,4-benzoquinol methylase
MTCNLCGSDTYSVLYREPPFLKGRTESELSSYYTYSSIFLGGRKPHHQIVKCSDCGLVYAHPRREASSIARSYIETPHDTSYLQTEQDRRRKFAREVNELTKIMIPGRILDIGCSIGIFLEEAQRAGFDPYGVDLSRWASEQAAAKGLKVSNATLSESRFADGFFDVVTMWDVIEHLTDPMSEMKEINRILKPKGWLVIATPDFSSLLSRLLGPAWQSVSLQHIYYFTPKTLGRLLGTCGFSIIKKTTDAKISSLDNLLSYFKNRRLIYAPLRGLFDRTGLGRMSVKLDPKDMIKVYAQKL